MTKSVVAGASDVRRRSIRIRMFWIISFFGCILTIAFAAIVATVVMRTTTAQAEQALNLETSRTNVRMDEYFGKAMQVLQLGARLPILAQDPHRLAVSHSAREELAAELDQIRETFGFLYMYYGLEADGSLIVADYETPDGFDARDRPWYRLARDGQANGREVGREIGEEIGREITVTHPYLDAATREWVASVSLPVHQDGKLEGVVALDISLDAITDMVFSASEYFPSLRNLIVSPEGEILVAAEQRLIGASFPVGRTGRTGRSAAEEPAASAGGSNAGAGGFAADLISPGGPGATHRLLRLRFDGEDHLAAIQRNDLTEFVLVSIIDPSEITGPAIRILLALLAITAVVLALYILVMNRIVARMITLPIMEIADDMRRVEALELEDTIEPRSRTYEIYLMQAASEMMKRSLRSFRRYVPSDVVTLLVQRHAEATLGAEKRELTLFFSDIEGFSSLSESLTPDQLAESLGYYFRGITAVLQEHSGTVDKFIGDAIMAFWGAPLEVANHAQLACRAALECQEFLGRARKWGRLSGFRTRIGINSGEAIVGNMGYDERMSYTAIGDSVNVASRFEGLNKYYGTSIVVTESTRRQAGSEFLFRKLDTVVVKGKSTGHTVYELIGYGDRMSADELAYYERFAEAIAAYDAREWKQAARMFGAIRHAGRRDRPLQILLKRCLRFVQDPPPADWRGEVYLRDK